MRLISVDFTLQNRKSVVSRTLVVHFIDIERWIADRIAFLVTRSIFFGRSIFPCEAVNFSRQTGEIENLKKIQKSPVFRKTIPQQVYKLINTYLLTEFRIYGNKKHKWDKDIDVMRIRLAKIDM